MGTSTGVYFRVFATSKFYLLVKLIQFFTMPEKLTSVITKFYDEYITSTSKRLKIIDAYLFYIFLTGVFQFCYCALVGTFPFNSFLSGFISCVGSFVIAGNETYAFTLYCIYLGNASRQMCSRNQRFNMRLAQQIDCEIMHYLKGDLPICKTSET